MIESNFSSFLNSVTENGVTILADLNSSCPKKSTIYYNEDFSLTRILVCSILTEYVNGGKSATKPVKCLDVKGSTGICGLLWKKYLSDKVEVYINDNNASSCKLIEENAQKNDLAVNILNKDPAIVLHESGYSFIYLEINTEAVYYFDAAFRNISRNSVLVITTKDDPSLQGSNGDVAYRRYGGRIARTWYSHELAIRLVISAMVRSAAKYNKGIKVLCSVTYKGSFTIAVSVMKNPDLANKCMENVRPLSHCMACEERLFHPINNGYLIDITAKMPACNCSEKAPSSTVIELGPVWAGEMYDADFVRGMIQHRFQSDAKLQSLLTLIQEEAVCERGKVNAKEEGGVKKKARLDEVSPPFYYNLHRHHPNLQHQLSITSVISRLKSAGFRASRTHFNKLSIRTDANLKQLYQVMSNNKT